MFKQTSSTVFDSGVIGPIIGVCPAAVELEPEPIPSGWVVSGSPEARSKKVASSQDWISQVTVWECTPGIFHWHYGRDETTVIIWGEAFMTNAKGEERRFGPGDLGFFPAGTSCMWRVTKNFRKVAVLREPVAPFLGLCLKITRKLLRALASRRGSLRSPMRWESHKMFDDLRSE